MPNLYLLNCPQEFQQLKSEMSQPVLHGKGLNRVLDPATARAAQIDASKILSTLPKNFFRSSLDQLASSAVQHLGFPAAVMNIEAQVVKLLLYYKGDHQSNPFDQDAKPGNFFSMIILFYFNFKFKFIYLFQAQLVRCFFRFQCKVGTRAAPSS